MLAALGLLSTTCWLCFPPQPITAEVERGRQVRLTGKGIERTLLEDRQVTGLWFDGRIRRDVEHVIHVSPMLVSRWLGYLQEKEMWPEGELQKRWELLREYLDGNVTMIAQVAAFPKIGFPDLEPAPVTKADPREVEWLRFSVKSGDGVFEPSATRIGRWTTRDWGVVDRFKWYLSVPFGQLMRPEFEVKQSDPGYPLGPYHAAWYLVQFPRTKLDREEPPFSLHIFSPEKERKAAFPTTQPRLQGRF